ncbi:MAG: SpoIIE family protein phosphatase [Candidatus Moduliflexus flocculans]|nr:SpoIIE family protein phosphatase [Candidatus Moduliflexus flocculans]
MEKPFGRDRAGARELNLELQDCLPPRRHIFRIDHYLGKETVQNLLYLRFANAVFEPLWNRRYVERVEIDVLEEEGIGTRGGYYDGAGAARDMLQNHLIQLLCLTAMEPPAGLDPESIRDEKVKVLKSIPAYSPEELRRRQPARPVRRRGRSPRAARASGYREEDRVAPGSADRDLRGPAPVRSTTGASSGVPFVLRTGKALDRRVSEIRVRFRRRPGDPLPGQLRRPPRAERPHPADPARRGALADLQRQGARQGRPCESGALEVLLPGAGGFPARGLRDRLLADALAGDSTLFIRADETEAAWSLVDRLEEAWAFRGSLGPPDLSPRVPSLRTLPEVPGGDPAVPYRKRVDRMQRSVTSSKPSGPRRARGSRTPSGSAWPEGRTPGPVYRALARIPSPGPPGRALAGGRTGGRSRLAGPQRRPGGPGLPGLRLGSGPRTCFPGRTARLPEACRSMEARLAGPGGAVLRPVASWVPARTGIPPGVFPGGPEAEETLRRAVPSRGSGGTPGADDPDAPGPGLHPGAPVPAPGNGQARPRPSARRESRLSVGRPPGSPQVSCPVEARRRGWPGPPGPGYPCSTAKNDLKPGAAGPINRRRVFQISGPRSTIMPMETDATPRPCGFAPGRGHDLRAPAPPVPGGGRHRAELPAFGVSPAGPAPGRGRWDGSSTPSTGRTTCGSSTARTPGTRSSTWREPTASPAPSASAASPRTGSPCAPWPRSPGAPPGQRAPDLRRPGGPARADPGGARPGAGGGQRQAQAPDPQAPQGPGDPGIPEPADDQGAEPGRGAPEVPPAQVLSRHALRGRSPTGTSPWPWSGGTSSPSPRMETDRVGVLIADVSGHGVAPAFITAMIRSLFDYLHPREDSPSVVIRRINEEFAKIVNTDHFVTAFYGIFDFEAMSCTYCGAGHPPSSSSIPTAAVTRLASEDPIIGMTGGLRTTTTAASPWPGGDLLCFYTDGVQEARNAKDEMFGVRGIEETVIRNWTRTWRPWRTP